MKRLEEWEARYNPASDTAEHMQALLGSAPVAELTAYMDEVSKRLHEEPNQELARLVLEVIAPLANQLNYQQRKRDLEDTAFAVLYPEQYEMTLKLLRQQRADRERDIVRLRQQIEAALEATGITDSEVQSRMKQPYSLYKKLRKTGTITSVHDLLAVRIITSNEADCYTALDAMHELYEPILDRFKDYIKQPKPNGYQSLHTTVISGKKRVEIQIRTHAMNDQAESGAAAHWHYDAHKESKDYRRGMAPAAAPEEQRPQVYVFSPSGDVYALPQEATGLDFAFAVHTQVGLRTKGVKINHRLAKLDTRLSNGDVVEIITGKEARPKRDWLQLVRSPKAQNRICSWLKQLEYDRHREMGKEMLLEVFAGALPKALEATATEHGLSSVDDLMVAVATRDISVETVQRSVYPPQPPATKPVSTSAGIAAPGKVSIGGMSGLQYRFARCCNPQSPRPIVGYITRSLGITIHDASCSSIQTDSERLLEAEWQ